jgi:hypothetical protein
MFQCVELMTSKNEDQRRVQEPTYAETRSQDDEGWWQGNTWGFFFRRGYPIRYGNEATNIVDCEGEVAKASKVGGFGV